MSQRKRGLQSRATKIRIEHEAEHPLANIVGRDEAALLIPIEQIAPDPQQPRKDFEQQTLVELSNSLLEHGLLQPLIVRAAAGKYVIVAGERRYRAALLAGLDALACRVLEDEGKLLEIQLVENLQRADLNLFEEAEALQALQDAKGASLRQLEAMTGKSKSYISRRLAILRMPAEVQLLLKEEPRLLTKAEELAKIEDVGVRERAIRRLLEQAGDEGSAAATRRTRGRPVKPFKFSERRSGAFDLVVKYRPGEVDRAELIALLRGALEQLENK